MSQWMLYAGAGMFIIVIGFVGAFDGRSHGVRRILAINVMGSGVFLVMVAAARRNADPPDPVPHALVLTGVVVSVSATGFALALARRLTKGRHHADMPGRGDRPTS